MARVQVPQEEPATAYPFEDENVHPEPEDVSEAETALEALREMGVDLARDEAEALEKGGFTLEELRRVVQNLEILDQLGGERLFRGQWAKTGGKYSLIGDTTPHLPAGYYDTAVDQAGTIWFESIRARTDELLRFPDAATDKIMAEIEIFWTREKIFQRFGLPFKRGILLYGPPGSGKTCTLQLLARDVVARSGIVLIYQPELFIHAYRQVRHIQPDTPIVVLMEDLDATLERHNESVVLNALDGTDTIERTVFVATTNYPEKLGERIINRPSRFDRRLFVGDPSTQARQMYLDALIKDREIPKGTDVVRMVKDTEGMSLAHVKELFVTAVVLGKDYKEAITDLKELHFEHPTSAGDRDKYHYDVKREGGYV